VETKCFEIRRVHRAGWGIKGCGVQSRSIYSLCVLGKKSLSLWVTKVGELRYSVGVGTVRKKAHVGVDRLDNVGPV
jgi:hypothetical protein